MAERPWEADRPLDLDRARAALRDQLPDLASEGLRHLGSGWEFDVYATSDGWAVRFPRRTEVVPLLKRDEAVLALVAPIVAPVLVPRIERWGAPGAHFPYPFAAHRLLPGVRADDARAPANEGFATALGALLGRLHATEPSSARAVGITVDGDDADEWLEETRAEAPAIRASGPVVERALDWLDAVDRPPPPYDGPLRVVHNDLGPDHWLVDPESGELVGLLDWTDIALGDPVLDFMGLWAWRGPVFVRRVLDAYPLAVDPRFVERVRFAVRVRTLHWLRSAEVEGVDVEKHVRWVENAFR